MPMTWPISSIIKSGKLYRQHRMIQMGHVLFKKSPA